MVESNSLRLGGKDFLLLAGVCLLLAVVHLVDPRTFTTHETVHCQNTREMIADGNWLIPHYGGRIWLERPPLPFWITASSVLVFGDHPFAYRVAPLAMAIIVTCWTGWMASVWFGRGLGLASGIILATMQEFVQYSTGPEADMFLCAVVTTAMGLWVRLEFCKRPATGEDGRFLGGRPWGVFAFFLVLALTNWAKGLLFGSIFVILPTGLFLLAQRNWSVLRRYVWLWGWLAYLGVGFAWAVYVYALHPGAIDFWKQDYGGRVDTDYMREPFYYYFAALPWILMPWTPVVFVGLWLARGQAWNGLNSPQRFLWCWALVPLLFFSIPRGKHHHYLLQALSPWAIFGALGAQVCWERFQVAAPLWRSPWFYGALGIPGTIALLVFRAKVPGPIAWQLILALAIPTYLAALAWAAGRRDPSHALACVCGIFLMLFGTIHFYRNHCRDGYRDDSLFLQAVREVVPSDRLVLVADTEAPLNASWILYYLKDRAKLLHNLSFLRDNRIADPDVYLLTRGTEEPKLAQYGMYDIVTQSRRSRYCPTPEHRYVLYHLHFRPDLAKTSPVYINPMQATGRAPGPFLD